jgi:hypothetical protein
MTLCGERQRTRRYVIVDRVKLVSFEPGKGGTQRNQAHTTAIPPIGTL